MIGFTIRFLISTIFVISILLPANSRGQRFFRIKADLTIKEKLGDTAYQLIIGKVFYDKNIGKLVYNISFPKKGTWVMNDTSLYIIQNDSVTGHRKIPQINKFTIFHLSLNGKLDNFGLDPENGPFTISSVEKEADLVISTWIPPEKYREDIGKFVISQKNKRLFGMVVINANDKVISKQFFENYQNFRGLGFPTRIVQFNYIAPPEEENKKGNKKLQPSKEKKHIKITTFENVKVNETGNEKMYNYSVPD